MSARLCAFGIWLLLIAAVSGAADPAAEKKDKRPSATANKKPSAQASALSDQPSPPVACEGETCKAPTAALAVPAVTKSSAALTASSISAEAAYEQIRQSREEAILAALNKPIELDVEDVPLSDVLDILRLKLDIQIVCDSDLVSTAKLHTKTVTLKVRGISARAVLDLVLEPLELSWDIRHEVLWIAEREKIPQEVVRVYDVSDLAAPSEEDEGGLDPIINAITTTVKPATWDSAGGAGTVGPMNIDGTPLLVIYQSRGVHAEIVKLLTELRRGRADSPQGAAVNPDSASGSRPMASRSARGSDMKPGGGPAGAAVSPDVQAVVRSNNQLACSFLPKIGPYNLVFSPFSLTTAMGMAYAGARGETATEIASGMHFTLDNTKLHPAMAALEKELLTGKPGEASPRFEIASRLWGQQDYSFLDSYLALTREHYGAELGKVDFSHQREAACKTMNEWVAKHTEGKITELLSAEDLDNRTRLVLTNAIYFKGKWRVPFHTSETDQAKFHPFTEIKAAANSAPPPDHVPLMFDDGHYNYAKTEGIQILEKPYAGTNLAMTILLPEQPLAAFDALQAGLSAGKLDGWLAQLRRREVKVYLPRFKLADGDVPLVPLLADHGIHRAFDPTLATVDLSGIDGKKDLFISDVVQFAVIEVDEEGTEAAAATAVSNTGALSTAPPPVVFRADHPFVFMIRDMRTGCIVFLGQFTAPPPAK